MGTTCFCLQKKNKTKVFNDLPGETPEQANKTNNNYIVGINQNSENQNYNGKNVYTPKISNTNLNFPSSYINSNMNVDNAQSNNIKNINLQNAPPSNSYNINKQNENPYIISNINMQNQKDFNNNINKQNEQSYNNKNINMQNEKPYNNNININRQNVQSFSSKDIKIQNEKPYINNNNDIPNEKPDINNNIIIQNENPHINNNISMQNENHSINSNINRLNEKPEINNNENPHTNNNKPYNNNKINLGNAPPSNANLNSSQNFQSSLDNMNKPDEIEGYPIQPELKDEQNNEESPNLDDLLDVYKIPNLGKNENNTMYDAIYSCESIKELYNKGWDYILYQEFIRRLQKDENDKEDKEVSEDKKFCPLCIIGETNKGKTFILNLLTNNRLESGIEYKTEGISCKFTNFNEENDNDETTEKKFLLLDTAGRSEPLLIDPEKKKQFTDEELKRTVESNNRDLKNSEEFMKNLLIKYSKIIVVVVNNLSLAEQLFLLELKTEANYEELFIIHNIFHFKTKGEMEKYIDNTIINSIYFDLSKDYYDIDDESQNSVDRPYYFTEGIKKNGVDKAIITHLILGDCDSKDPWIKNFNDKTIDFMKTKMQDCIASDYFDIGNILKEELIGESIVGEKTKITKSEQKYEIPKEHIKGKLNIEGNAEIKENDNIYDNYIIRGYTPHYIHYKNEEKGQMSFVIEVECAGKKDENISITAKQRKTKTFFNIEGKKIYPSELKMLNPSKYADKPFTINFYVNNEKEREGKEFYKIDTSDGVNKEKPTYENGIYKKVFPMIKVKKQVRRLKTSQ